MQTRGVHILSKQLYFILRIFILIHLLLQLFLQFFDLIDQFLLNQMSLLLKLLYATLEIV